MLSENSEADKLVAIVQEMLGNLKTYRRINKKRKKYLEDKIWVRSLGISDPPNQRPLKMGNGWSKLAITELQERVSFEGFFEEENEASQLLDRVYTENALSVEGSFVHGDSFSYGVGYVGVSYGDVEMGEPEILVTPESPFTTTHRYNRRTRRTDWVLCLRDFEEKKGGSGTLFGTHFNVDLIIAPSGRILLDLSEEGVDNHGRGRTQIVCFPNSEETGKGSGHSEISEAVMSLQEDALRTLNGMAINREAYSYPSRYILGLDAEQLQDEQGNMVAPTSLMATTATLLPPNGNDQLPQVGTWETGDPTAFAGVYRMLAQIFSSTTSIPASRLISNDANPTSGDAIRQNEGPIIKKAETKIKALAGAWEEVGRLILMLGLDGGIPEGFKVKSRFREPDSAARQANAQEAATLITAGVLQPDSTIVLDRIGLSRSEQDIVKAENLRARTAVLAEVLANTPSEVVPVPEEV